MPLEINNKTFDLVTLDFETAYDQEYSLKSKHLNTIDYIRHERFHAHGVGIKRSDKKTKWVTGAAIRKELDKIDWTSTALLCHNTAFDGFILHERYGIHPAFYLDTMLMARAAHGANAKVGLDFLAKIHGLAGKTKAGALVNVKGKWALTADESRQLGSYCVDDCDDTYALFHKLYAHVPDDELRLIDLTLRMFCDPVLLLDEERCRREYQREVDEKQAALDYVKALCTVKDLQSAEKFAQLLRDQGVEPPMKVSLTTGEPTYAFAKTDFEFVELMEEGPPVVQALCAARVRNKTTTNETRALRFLNTGLNGQLVPVALNYCGAHTFRWSGGQKMNMQNLMRGGELRRSLIAPPGYVIVVADSAQIEARTLAWLAGEAAIVEAFAAKQDVYKLMASRIYNKPVEQITKDERFVGKVCLGPDTLVLTKRGYIPITKVEDDDWVFDGEQWVPHGGLSDNGVMRCIEAYGLTATFDHEIFTGTRWEYWEDVVEGKEKYAAALRAANSDACPPTSSPRSKYVKCNVYDLLNCGPRKRFTVMSKHGPIIVHNCVLGLGYGMGGQKLNDTLAKGAMGPKVILPLDETKRIVNMYRMSNVHITKLWKKAEEILIDMILGRTGTYGPLEWMKNAIRMPNGLFMQYNELSGEIYQGRGGVTRLSDAWYRGKRDAKTYIYGGSATENWVQSLARCIVAEQMLTVSERYRIITMSHDEIVALAPENEAEECLAFMLEVMSTAPEWAPGLPLAAEGGYDVCYSK